MRLIDESTLVNFGKRTIQAGGPGSGRRPEGGDAQRQMSQDNYKGFMMHKVLSSYGFKPQGRLAADSAVTYTSKAGDHHVTVDRTRPGTTWHHQESGNMGGSSSTLSKHLAGLRQNDEI